MTQNPEPAPKPTLVSTQTDGDLWLAEFQARMGRPLKVLHFGNIANNAYNNAKVQRARGIEAHVVAPDYYHIMGCPEWEDAGIEGDIADPFYPDFWSVNTNGFERPDWFVQGPAHLCRSYLLHSAAGNESAKQLYWRYLQAYRYSLVKPHIRKLIKSSDMTKAHFKRLALFVERLANGILNTATVSLADTFRADMQAEQAMRELERNGDRERPIGDLSVDEFRTKYDVSEADYNAFNVTARHWQPLFHHYDIIQSYSTDPIWPFLSQLDNYVAYEHGTIREIPFQDDPVGRLSKRAYLAAPAVFITNVDNIKAADRLGLSEEQRHYLPHAFDCRKLLAYAESCGVTYDAGAPKQIFMPSRQHWVDGDPNWAKGNDNVIRAARLLKDRGLAPAIKFVEWGNDVEASKQLIAELGIEELITWSPMLNKQQLWEEYLRSTGVIDQFLLPGISGVSFEAMTLGIPVITHDEGDLNERFFSKAPPLLAASSPEQVADRIAMLMTDNEFRIKTGRDSARWILDYHAPERIFDIQVNAFMKMLN